MNGIVYSLFISLSIRMTLITAIVMAIKLLFKHKLSAAAHCAVWLIPCIQTVFCIGNVSIPAKTSIYNFVRDIPNAAPLDVSGNSATAAAYAAVGGDIRNVIALVYFAGAALLFAWYAAVFLIHLRRITAAEDITDETALDALKDVKSRLGIHTEIRLKRGETAHTLSNMVVMPKNFSAAEEWQVILHELCHFKHKDNVKLWCAVFVICLNWFNPLIWLAFSRFRTDIEMYCDDSVIKYGASRREYAHMLIKSVVRHAHFVPGISGAAVGKSEVAKRVKRIAAWKEKKPIWLVAAVFASVAISCICLTDAVTVAVENKVDVAATPEPINVIPNTVNTAVPTGPPMPSDTPVPAAPAENAAAYDAEPDTTAEISSTPAVYEISGGYAQTSSKNSDTADTADDVVIFAANDSEPVAETPPESEQVTSDDPQSAPEYVPESDTLPRSDTAADGADSDTVDGKDGALEDISVNGSKKTYSLDNGDTAVVHYRNGEPETGYIISGEDETETALAE